MVQRMDLKLEALRMGEMYLIRAEAQSRTSQGPARWLTSIRYEKPHQ
jgi:hypothetical protein